MTFPTEHLALLSGVVLALFFIVRSTDNPAAVPLVRVLGRALPGFFVFVIVWFTVAFLFALLTAKSLSFVRVVEGGSLAMGFLMGWLLPLSVGRLKDLLVTQQFVKQVHALAVLLQGFDEFTRLNFSKLLAREERKIAFELLMANYAAKAKAVDRLFEFHHIEIAKEVADKKGGTDAQRALGILQIRDTGVKLKYLLRHLGYAQCAALLPRVSADPILLYPTWPPEQCDRRRDARPAVIKQRRQDPEYVAKYILGKIGSL